MNQPDPVFLKHIERQLKRALTEAERHGMSRIKLKSGDWVRVPQVNLVQMHSQSSRF